MFVKSKKPPEIKIWYEMGFIGDWGQIQSIYGPCSTIDPLLTTKGGKGLKIFKTHFFKNFLQKQEVLYTWKKKKWVKKKHKRVLPNKHFCFFCGAELPLTLLGVVKCPKCKSLLVCYLDKDLRKNFINYSETNEK